MSRYPEGFADRFWKRVKKARGRGCWEWQGYRAKETGYGMLQCRSRRQQPMLTHRVAWELENGPIPRGKHVLHACDNPSCVRPFHLFLGTQCDNNRDRDRKGRTASGDSNGSRTKPWRNPFVRNRGSGLEGEKHPQAKLSDRQVKRLRTAFDAGFNRNIIAEEYGISVTHVYRLGGRKLRK